MAHKKGVGSSKNGRESHSKRLGIKLFGGQIVKAGNILVRQRGTVHCAGQNVGIGKDHTLYALIDGVVVFRKKADNKSYVSVMPKVVETVAAISAPAPSAPVNEEKTPPKASAKPRKVTKKAETEESASAAE